MSADVLSLVDVWGTYTYRTMFIGTVLIGVFSGGLGCLLYQRKQSLLADVIGHSALAGVVGAFLVATLVFGVNGRGMLVLTLGAIVSSVAAAVLANVVSARTRVRIDAAMAVCLAIFYGTGMVGLRYVAQSDLPNRQGIDTYLFGNAATLTATDLLVIGTCGAIATGILLVFYRPLTITIFDPTFAAVSGYAPRVTGTILFLITTIAIVIGVKTVGLVLMIAFAIMPAATARLWTNHMHTMMLVAAGIGAFAGAVGSALAVSVGHVPTGPVIVLILSVLFFGSLLASPRRSILRTWATRQRLARAEAKEVAA